MMVDESVRQGGSGLAVSVFAWAEASEGRAPLVVRFHVLQLEHLRDLFQGWFRAWNDVSTLALCDVGG
jgi:hypothetical protein